jgi:hypothetical protein
VRGTDLVTVKGEEELESVLVEDLDGGVEESDGKETTVGRVANREDVVGHLESSGVDEGESLRFELS